jgi:hypothetical protein
MNMISWSQIEAECGNYREGFVATFRKYEGQDTDERDARGLVVKVTVASFARHVGINERTFRLWVGTVKNTAISPEQRTSMNASGARKQARQLPPTEKAKLAAELLDEPDVADQVVDNPQTRLQVHKALNRRYDDRTDSEWRAPDRVTQENPHEAEDDAYRLLIKLRGADRALTDAAVLAQNIRGVSAKEAATLEPVIERMRGLLDLISTGLSGGPLDVELRALLDAEAGS